jgi:hypothetical protein
LSSADGYISVQTDHSFQALIVFARQPVEYAEGYSTQTGFDCGLSLVSKL